MPEVTKEQIEALEEAAEAQTAYWEALTRLEAELAIDFDSTVDLQGHTVESLIGEFKEQEGEDGDAQDQS